MGLHIPTNFNSLLIFIKINIYYRNNKIGTVIKHIPGHGCSSLDSHFNLPRVNKSIQELNKIAVCVSDKETVTEDLVRRFCSTTRGATVFELANAIGERNCQDALKLAETFLNTGNHPAIALKMIDRHYSLLLKAKAELEKGYGADEIAKVIGVHPFFARAYVDQSRSFSTSRIWRCLGILKEGDWQIRSYGRRLEKFVMDRMIVQLCAKPCNSKKN